MALSRTRPAPRLVFRTSARSGGARLSLAAALLGAGLWGLWGAAGVSFADDGPVAAPDPLGEKQPLLVIPEPEYDWGTAFRGERIEHTFVIRNDGDATLRIEDVKPQCGCTLAKDFPRELAPGESTDLTLTLETGALKGIKKKYTEIISNALTDENKLWMEGEIEDLLTLDPGFPRVEAVLATRRPRAPEALRLTPNLEKSIEIRSVGSRDGLVKAWLTEPAQGERQRRAFEILMQAQVSGDDRTAFQSDVIELDVVVDSQPVALRFPVTVALLERIAVEPARSIHFARKDTEVLVEPTAGAAAAAPERTLEITSIGDPEHRFRLTDVTTDSELFEATVEPVADGKHYRLTVRVTGTPPGGKRFLKGKILLETDDPEVPEIEIPAMAQFGRRSGG